MRGKILEVLRDARMIGEELEIIEGNCRGADRMAGEIGGELGIQVTEFDADWEKHGRAAGPIRNSEMLKEKPDVVMAFTKNLEKSVGTKDLVDKARALGIQVFLVDEAGNETEI